MSQTPESFNQGEWLDQAMMQAIQADQLAALSISESRKQAEEILLNARHQAAEIEARLDRRMAVLQKSRAKSLKRHLETIKRHQQRAAPFQLEPPANLDPPGAARQLAAWLTGADG
ncbi:MAG: hypothetical protein G8237_00570 [Magnetococcales bacterium]|nr:hypothetical protein [Magnetococcales bacterium]NGZ04833.1 hypothetical protein [Magnetococcales bacterium]